MKRLGRILWIAATPLALTLLVSTPVLAGSSAPQEGHGGEHDVVTNPIQNFWTLWAYKEQDVHGGPLEEGDTPMPGPFLGTLVNFGLFLFLLGKFAVPSFVTFTRERHDRIADQLAESARLRSEAQKALDEYRGRLARLDDEIKSLVAEIRAEADTEKQRILAEAQARAERMKRDAEAQIKAEMARVRIEIEREAIQIAVATAEKLLREKVNDADQKSLVERFVSEVETSQQAVTR